MILHESNLVRVEFDSSVPCVTWTPLEFMSGDKFKEPFTVGMDFVVEKIREVPSLGWLNDTRKLKAVRIEDVKWLDKNINDRAYTAGIKKVAFVLPENIFGRMGTRLYVEFTTKRADNLLEIKAFKTIVEAKLWLKGTPIFKMEDIKL